MSAATVQTNIWGTSTIINMSANKPKQPNQPKQMKTNQYQTTLFKQKKTNRIKDWKSIDRIQGLNFL